MYTWEEYAGNQNLLWVGSSETTCEAPYKDEDIVRDGMKILSNV